MPRGKHNSPKPKNVLPKAAAEFGEKFEAMAQKGPASKDESGLTCTIPDGPVKEHLKKMYDMYEREQMRQFEEGFGYRAPGDRWTLCTEMLPEEATQVLALCLGHWQDNSDPLRQRKSFKVFQGKFECNTGWTVCGPERFMPVIAWMYIPEFPDNWIEEHCTHG